MSPFSFSYRDHLIAKTTWTKSNCCSIHVPLAFSLTNFYALETFSAFIEALYLGVATNPPPKTKKSFKSWNLITRSFLPVYRRGADKPQDIVRKHEPKNVYWWNLKIKAFKRELYRVKMPFYSWLDNFIGNCYNSCTLHSEDLGRQFVTIWTIDLHINTTAIDS